MRTAFIGLCITLTACATPYAPATLNGGYSESQLAPDTFRVSFNGNIRATQKEADEMALLRGAEVALAHGFPFFITSGSTPTGTTLSIATNAVAIPASTITIYGYPFKPETSAIVYDAQYVKTTLGEKYERR